MRMPKEDDTTTAELTCCFGQALLDASGKIVAVTNFAKKCLLENVELLVKFPTILVERETISAEEFQRFTAETGTTMMPHTRFIDVEAKPA